MLSQGKVSKMCLLVVEMNVSSIFQFFKVWILKFFYDLEIMEILTKSTYKMFPLRQFSCSK